MNWLLKRQRDLRAKLAAVNVGEEQGEPCGLVHEIGMVEHALDLMSTPEGKAALTRMMKEVKMPVRKRKSAGA